MKIKRSNKKSIIIVSAAVLLLTLGLGVYFTKSILDRPSETTTQDGKKVVSDPNVPDGRSDSSTGVSDGIYSPKDENENSPNNQAVKPSEPIGSFVSNHYPNLSGSPRPNSIASTCTTTPGASCKIVFTMGRVVKELTGKSTDQNGNTEWNWTLQSIGITEGTWKIKAIATNGNLSASSSDSIDMVVSP